MGHYDEQLLEVICDDEDGIVSRKVHKRLHTSHASNSNDETGEEESRL